VEKVAKPFNKKKYSKSTSLNNDHKNDKKYFSKDSRRHKNNSPSIPKWDFDTKYIGKEFTVTKANLMEILGVLDKDELLMSPLILKNKVSPIKKIEKENNDILHEESENKVIIDITQTCPICDKKIHELIYALHDHESDKLAHFDCVYRKISVSIKDQLSKGRHLAYLGSGSFGIMESVKNKSSILIEKIYPSAPPEESEEISESKTSLVKKDIQKDKKTIPKKES